MPIKARPFTTKIGEVEVEGFFEDESFVFRFYGLVTFRPPLTGIGEDDLGRFAILEETEISQPDGFTLSVETNYDPVLESEWGYVVSLRRAEINDRTVLQDILERKGIDPQSVNLIVPPRQITSVYVNPRGKVDGSAQLDEDLGLRLLREEVSSSAALRMLFLPHAVRQMSRPDRMITPAEVRNVVVTGAIIENYPNDPRGHSCLILGTGTEDRPIHVVCSPTSDFLAIITAYLPDRHE